MENAVQALKMAAAVLIFIIAITLSFAMFSKTKATTDSIIRIQDKQAYLDSPKVNGGLLYTSSEDDIPTMTTDGNRIVKANDVISTLYRYWLEQYNVTIIKNKRIIARFDSDTETQIQHLPGSGYIIDSTTKEPIVDDEGNKITVEMELNAYTKHIKSILKSIFKNTEIPVDLKEIYKIKSKSNKKFGAPWYGDDIEIIKRINAELNGEEYIYRSRWGNLSCRNKT